MKLVTKFVCKFFKTDDIIRYVMDFDSELNSEELDILVKKICSSNNFTYIYWFTYVTKNLSEENKKTLVNTVCNMENSRYIYVFAKYIKGLSEENKKALKSAILSLNDTEFIDRYALYIDKSIIFEKYGTVENFHLHLNEVENNKKDSILKHKKYVYKI